MSREDASTARAGTPRRRTVVRLLLWLGFLLAAGGALAGALSGFGHQWDWWDFRRGFAILRWSAYAGLAGLGLSSVAFLTAALLRRWPLMVTALPGMALGLMVAGVPLSYLQYAESVPPIHDITTDTADPPKFVALAEAREAAPNAAAYPGESAATRQKRAYPAVEPLEVDVSPARAFEAALAEVRAAGWHVAASDPEAGRVEATATTFWYGFKDDVVVRVIGTGTGGSRIDVRSASRVGVSDLGTNAARIRAYLDGLEARLEAG